MSEKKRTELEEESLGDKVLHFANIFFFVLDLIVLFLLVFCIFTIGNPSKAKEKTENHLIEQTASIEEFQDYVEDEVLDAEVEDVVEEKPKTLEELYPDLNLGKKGYVDALNGLNVHKDADLNSEVIGLLEDWQIVEILETTENLYKVQAVPKSKLLGKDDPFVAEDDDDDILVGYVSKDYINESSLKEEKYLLISAVIVRNSSLPNRDHNMSLACSKIDGIILKPGEELNWFGEDGISGVVGPASQANGYEQATIIVDRKPVQGYGGGVCQVSTSVYNLIMQIGIEPTEIHHHSLPSHYIGLGKDATVASSSNPAYDKNFVFTNTKDYPIMIKMSEEAGCVTALCYRILTQE